MGIYRNTLCCITTHLLQTAEPPAPAPSPEAALLLACPEGGWGGEGEQVGPLLLPALHRTLSGETAGPQPRGRAPSGEGRGLQVSEPCRGTTGPCQRRSGPPVKRGQGLPLGDLSPAPVKRRELPRGTACN